MYDIKSPRAEGAGREEMRVRAMLVSDSAATVCIDEPAFFFSLSTMTGLEEGWLVAITMQMEQDKWARFRGT